MIEACLKLKKRCYATPTKDLAHQKKPFEMKANGAFTAPELFPSFLVPYFPVQAITQHSKTVREISFLHHLTL